MTDTERKLLQVTAELSTTNMTLIAEQAQVIVEMSERILVLANRVEMLERNS